MVLPRIANPFRAFLGRCRFESGLFRQVPKLAQDRGQPRGCPASRAQPTGDHGGFAVKFTPVFSREDAVKPPNDRLAQLARAVVSRGRVPDRLARGSVADLTTGTVSHKPGGTHESQRQRISDLSPLWAEDQNESNRRHHENDGFSSVVPVV